MSAVLRSALVSTTLLGFASAAHAEPDVLAASARLPKMPLIGDKAYDFVASSTRGTVRFPEEYKGKWVVFFSHPGDFTPVCTSEFIALAKEADEFAQLNTELLGLSTDSVESHRRWLASIRDRLGFEIPFPIIGDEGGEIAWSYGMIHPTATNERTVRAVFIVDPKGVIRATLYYPMESGRHIEEIKRLIIALQTADAHRVVTPANWQPGDDVLLPADPKHPRGKGTCKDWYYCEAPMPKSRLKLPEQG